MIHMLSRFNLKSGIDPKVFADRYLQLVAEMQSRNLAETSGPVGRRFADTPMDTDAPEAQEYYAVMIFRDAVQLNSAYAFLNSTQAHSADAKTHEFIKDAVETPVFTCWQDIE